MKKLRVFIDSNVWFSAFYKEGICSRLLRLLSDSSHEIVISEQVLEEIIKNIQEKIPQALTLVIQYMDTVKPTVAKNPSRPLLPRYNKLADKKDLPILISAIEYRCDYFITGNIKDFKIQQGSKTTLKIYTPSQFIQTYINKVKNISKA